MNLKNTLKKIRSKRHLKKVACYTKLNTDSYYAPSFYVELRNPKWNHIYLTTGMHCVLDGRYVFEKESGKIIIGDRTHIGGSTFISINSIEIGNDVTIAWDCLFYDHNSHAVDWNERKNDTEQEYSDIMAGKSEIANKNWSVVKSAPIKICDKVWIGYGATILKGVTIGEGAVIAARSVVTKDVEPWTVVGGNPATKIKEKIYTEK